MKTKTFILLITFVSLLSCSCTKEVIRTNGKLLGERTVSADEGQFPVLVNVSGVWSASSLSSWISVDTSLHKDKATFEVRYQANTSYFGKSNFNRLGKVVVSTHDGCEADTLVLKQKGIEPHLEFPKDNVVPLSGGRNVIPLTTNIGDECRARLVFSCDRPWVGDCFLGDDGTSLVFDVDEASGQRSATITATFTPQWGDVFTTTCQITQK